MFRAPMRRCIAFVVASVQRQENFGSLFSGKLRLRDTRNRATRNPDYFASDRLDLFLNFVRFCHPSSIKVEGALCHAAASVSGCVNTRVSTMDQLEQMILSLIIGSSIPDFGDQKLCILNSAFFSTTLAEGSFIKSDNRGMTEIGIHTIETGRICDSHIRA